MAALAERAKPQPGQATACLFCKYNDVQRQDPIRAVKTLAYQLAEAIPSLRPTFQALAVTVCGKGAAHPTLLFFFVPQQRLNSSNTRCRRVTHAVFH